MKRTIVPLGLAAVLVITAACGGSQAPVRAEETPAPQAQPMPVPAADPRAIDTERRANDRKRAIEIVNGAFGESPDAWVDAVRGETGTHVCALMERYRKLDAAMSYVEGEAESIATKVRWEETNIAREDGRKAFRDAATAYAKALYGILRNPPPYSADLTCGGGEGTLALFQPDTVANQIIEALTNAKTDPSAAGLGTSAQFRAAVQAAFRAQIASLRKEIRDGAAGEAADYYLESLMTDAVDKWGFEASQVGVGESELQAARIR